MWSSLNSGFNESFQWHEFMHMTTTFYTPDLSPFLKRWDSKQYNRLHRKYTSVLDGKTIYSVRMEVPNTGANMEVIADHVDKRWSDDFEEYKSTECGPSSHVPFSQSQLKGTWMFEGGQVVNSSTVPGGLPLLILVQVRENAWMHSRRCCHNRLLACAHTLAHTRITTSLLSSGSPHVFTHFPHAWSRIITSCPPVP